MKSKWIRIVVSVLAILAVIVEVTNWRDVKFSWEAVVLIAIAFLPWLSEFVESFTLGTDSLEVKLREIEKKADAAIDASLRGVAKSPSTKPGPAEQIKTSIGGDPQKRQWGGKPSNNGRVLSAHIERIPNESFYHRVILRVESTDLSKPLTGKVIFHLHPTFNTPDIDVPVVNGIAETSIVSYGAFTVGAEADKGATQLELDLTSLDDGKDQFFQR